MLKPKGFTLLKKNQSRTQFYYKTLELIRQGKMLLKSSHEQQDMAWHKECNRSFELQRINVLIPKLFDILIFDYIDSDRIRPPFSEWLVLVYLLLIELILIVFADSCSGQGLCYIRCYKQTHSGSGASVQIRLLEPITYIIFPVSSLFLKTETILFLGHQSRTLTWRCVSKLQTLMLINIKLRPDLPCHRAY